MAKIKVHCPNCGRQYLIDEQYIGRNVQCKACQSRFPVSIEESDQAAATRSAAGSAEAPPDAVAWKEKGDALDRLGRYEEALAAYDRALALRPDYADAWRNKGAAL